MKMRAKQVGGKQQRDRRKQKEKERRKEGKREAKADSFTGGLRRTPRAIPKEGRMIREKH